MTIFCCNVATRYRFRLFPDDVGDQVRSRDLLEVRANGGTRRTEARKGNAEEEHFGRKKRRRFVENRTIRASFVQVIGSLRYAKIKATKGSGWWYRKWL